jgi:uncharacterized protein YjdB
MKKLLFIVFALLLSVNAFSQTAIETSKFTDNVYVSVGGTTNLNASVQPSNASDKSLSYTVSNSNIATVDGSGNVHGKKKGETRVTIRTSNGIEKGVYIVVE